MPKTLTRLISIGALCVVGLATAGCGPVEEAGQQSQAQVGAGASTPSVEPTADPTPTYVAPAIGQPVPAADIDAARAAGVNVYVSPRGDGTGIVVDPAATIPQVVYDDLFATSVASVTDAQLATDEQLSAEPDMEEPVKNAVMAANFRLLLVYPLFSVNDPHHPATYKSGFGGGYLLPTVEETKALNADLRDFLVEGVPVGQARLDKADADHRTPETFLAAVAAFHDAHPAQVVILK